LLIVEKSQNHHGYNIRSQPGHNPETIGKWKNHLPGKETQAKHILPDVVHIMKSHCLGMILAVIWNCHEYNPSRIKLLGRENDPTLQTH
jgi:hypothetical protein